LETSGLVEVVDAATIVAVSGGEQALLAAAVVDEPSGGAGIRGLAVGVVDAYADTGATAGAGCGSGRSLIGLRRLSQQSSHRSS
jgi:hypothetical protein